MGDLISKKNSFLVRSSWKVFVSLRWGILCISIGGSKCIWRTCVYRRWFLFLFTKWFECLRRSKKKRSQRERRLDRYLSCQIYLNALVGIFWIGLIQITRKYWTNCRLATSVFVLISRCWVVGKWEIFLKRKTMGILNLCTKLLRLYVDKVSGSEIEQSDKILAGIAVAICKLGPRRRF